MTAPLWIGLCGFLALLAAVGVAYLVERAQREPVAVQRVTVCLCGCLAMQHWTKAGETRCRAHGPHSFEPRRGRKSRSDAS